jgi:Ca-activated chloride channel family protein
MFAFNWPCMLLLLPLPLITWTLLPANKNANDDTMPELLFPYTNRLNEAFAGRNVNHPKSKKWFIITLSLLWFFLVLTVMCPIWRHQSLLINSKGYDIMLAVDISLSMNIVDSAEKEKSITRLDSTKEVVTNFTKQRQGDRLGLILFGEHAYLQVPMTSDTFGLNQMLNKAMPGMAGPSTAIGDAIGIAVRELRNRTDGSKILILLTDGADTSSSIQPLKAAEIAKQYNIRIYTIGIGDQGSAFFTDANGKVSTIDTSMDEKLLQDIANITGGQYFVAREDQTLEKIYNKINELEKIDLTTKEYQFTSLYRYPLGVACLLFLMLCLSPLYRRFVYGV